MSKREFSQVETDGGAYIQGNVIVSEKGLFVGRDYITIQKNIYDFDRIFLRLLTTLGLFRLKRLEEMKAFSKGRCLERWLALGVPDEKATSFLENPVFDRSHQVAGLIEPGALKILVGDFGVGKSLIVENLFQRLVDEAINNKKSPIPIFIPSSQFSGNLLNDIKDGSSLIGNINRFGVRVIVDGADEIPIRQTELLLQQAITITKANPKISIIITSRPNPVFEKENLQKLSIPELSNDEILSIIVELSEREEHHHLLYGLPQSIVDALKKPFFTILYGLYRRQYNQGIFKSQGELIFSLVEMVVTKIDDPQVLDLLEKLAILSINREGKYVLASDVGSEEQIKVLLKSRLVIARQNLVGFALPILAQWFAAKSIENNKISTNELTSDLVQIEKWRYPFMILVSGSSFEKVSEILIPVAEKHPSIISEIIDGAVNNYSLRDLDLEDVGLPTAREMGERILQSIQALSNGLGYIAQHLAPITQDGKVSKIGVHKSNRWLSILWYGDIQEQGIVELPEDFGHRFQRGEYPWHIMSGVQPGAQSAWAWHFTLNALKENMRKLIDRKSLVLAGGHSDKELMWKLALQIMQRGDLSDRPILLNELRDRLNFHHIPIGTIHHRLLEYLDNLEASGELSKKPPWPGPDKDYRQGGWIWSPYSPERLLERLVLVLEASINEYVSFVNIFFKPFAERLTTYLTLPAKLTGYLDYSEASIGLDWYFDPILTNEKSSIDIRLRNEPRHLQRPIGSDGLYEKLRKMRPQLSHYYGVSSQALGHELLGPTPVTDFVFDWLKRDLRDISWLG